ncbi:histidinol-phosphatase [Carboxydothermus ferrireducens]|uniref:Histidinol-phosphatase n=1 Tax=Carboxydothermus ferrireducens DSM 11255 TaxID=1119529 RepID=A0ABX2RFG8_9THEO|nr:histidinol-phosphatase [Carboxydothermus ferrireducens]NYE58798.1 histidinol-phosphatase (PHP family) [Carboxydothermus ferrireducens DSM 11255]
MIDLHVHTVYSGHGEGEFEDYIQKAREKGVTELGFSEHFPMALYGKDFPGYSMEVNDWPKYLRKLFKLKETYPFLKIGLEVDYFPESEGKIKKALKDLPVDYLIGSVHFIDNWPFDDPAEIESYRGKDLKELTAKYFDLVKKVIRSGIFNVIGHLDLIKKFGLVSFALIEPHLPEIFLELKNSGMVLEINTAGLRYPAKEQYPSKIIIEEAVREKIPLTTGSDAHKPEHLAYKFPEIYQMLEEIGVKNLTTFANQKAREIPLNRP